MCSVVCKGSGVRPVQPWAVCCLGAPLVRFVVIVVTVVVVVLLLPLLLQLLMLQLVMQLVLLQLVLLPLLLQASLQLLDRVREGLLVGGSTWLAPLPHHSSVWPRVTGKGSLRALVQGSHSGSSSSCSKIAQGRQQGQLQRGVAAAILEIPPELLLLLQELLLVRQLLPLLVVMNPGLDLGLKACPHQPICGLTCCPFLWVVRAGREVRERAVMVLAVLVVLPEAGVQCRQAADAVHLGGKDSQHMDGQGGRGGSARALRATTLPV